MANLDEQILSYLSILESIRFRMKIPLELTEFNMDPGVGANRVHRLVVSISTRERIPADAGTIPDLAKCTCSDLEIKNYLGKISQPFLDRIDICIETPRVPYEALQSTGSMSSEEMREQVERVRKVQLARFQNEEIRTNSQMKIADLSLYCNLDEEGEQFMKNAYQAFYLTARGYHRVMKVARTIADLEGSENIRAEHLREAVGYRMIDQKYWRR